ncbi:BrnT family toxin [Moraxella sp. VT-16-12]|uniref:BrnT family toxin n=1 Tax=Moraxella sp. VT-16-12 TaxID=2014877 RepID=UPI000B802BB5|nr:BrnT family toxin [Moraxella sp. VT-16-12]TWV81502.1 BrnT family toxin [Moraxella sp. VT-16-12]
MPISYDETKRLTNIDKHGIDFIGCETIFDNPMLTYEDNRFDYGEMRLQSYGILGNQVVFMVWTDREKPHIISIRPADKQETKKFIKAIYG